MEAGGMPALSMYIWGWAVFQLTFSGHDSWPEGIPYVNYVALARHEYERRQRGELPLWQDERVPRYKVAKLPDNALAMDCDPEAPVFAGGYTGTVRQCVNVMEMFNE